MGYIQDLIGKGYGGYQGWNDENAVRADFQKTGGAGKYTGMSSGQPSQQSVSQPSGGGDMSAYFQQQNQLQQQAIQPAIQSLQAQIPTIKQNVATQVSQKQAEIAPLTERYKNLIDQIKGTGQTSVNKQTVVTAGELGKRGIEGSSTLAGQEIASATLPIEQQTQALVKDTGFSQEADLRDIANQIANLQGSGTEREQAVQQAIAQLQAGGGQTAITNALGMYNNAQASASAARQNEIQNELARLQLNNQSTLNAANIAKINEEIRKSRVEAPTVVDTNKYYGNNVTNKNGNIQSSSSGTWIPGNNSNWSIQQ